MQHLGLNHPPLDRDGLSEYVFHWRRTHLIKEETFKKQLLNAEALSVHIN